MLNPHGTHEDQTPFELSEDREDATYLAERAGELMARSVGRSENADAGAPRVFCIGFGIIRI